MLRPEVALLGVCQLTHWEGTSFLYSQPLVFHSHSDFPVICGPCYGHDAMLTDVTLSRKVPSFSQDRITKSLKIIRRRFRGASNLKKLRVVFFRQEFDSFGDQTVTVVTQEFADDPLIKLEIADRCLHRDQEEEFRMRFHGVVPQPHPHAVSALMRAWLFRG